MGVYRLTVTRSGYLTVEQNVIVYRDQDVSYNTVIEIIGSEWIGEGTASGTVYDALTGAGVPELTLKIRKGLNNTEGEVLETFETDRSGRYCTPQLESANYCIEIVDDRSDVAENHLGTSINVKILGGINIDNQDATVSNTILTGQLRIVLTWGEVPSDLDSHLDCALLSGENQHICFWAKTFYVDGERIADLDLDDTSSYGPETTTIYREDPGEYDFMVHNFSGGEKYALARSGACVQVYMGYSQIPSYVFYVPNEPGYYWEVFHYSSVTGVLTPVNVIEQ